MEEEDVLAMIGPMEKGIRCTVYCECGVSVVAENLERHRKSKSHRIALQRALHLAQRGGKVGLWSCPCGEYITLMQRQSHTEGKRHHCRMVLVARGAEVCMDCNLPYAGRLAYHLDAFEHVENAMRKKIYVAQGLEKEHAVEIAQLRANEVDRLNDSLTENYGKIEERLQEDYYHDARNFRKENLEWLGREKEKEYQVRVDELYRVLHAEGFAPVGFASRRKDGAPPPDSAAK
jgi:hypothetical protein